MTDPSDKERALSEALMRSIEGAAGLKRELAEVHQRLENADKEVRLRANEHIAALEEKLNAKREAMLRAERWMERQRVLRELEGWLKAFAEIGNDRGS